MRSAGSLFIQHADLLLSNLKILLSRSLIVQTLVEFDKIHVQLNSVQRSLGWSLWQVSQRGVVFACRVVIVFLKSGNFTTDGVQPIIFWIDPGCALQERLRMFNRSGSDFGLRCGKLQT